MARLLLAVHSAGRSFASRPRAIIPIVMVAAVALAVNTAFYTVVDGLFLRNPAVRDPSSIVHLDLDPEDFGNLATHNPNRIAELQSYFASSQSLADHADVSLEPAFDLGSTAQTEWHLRSAYVTANFLSFLGISPVVGQSLTDAGALGSPREVLIGYDLWRNRFGSDPSIIGRVIEVPGSRRDMTWRVVGVMPPGFSFPKGVNFWIASTQPSPWGIPTFARLQTEVSINRVRSDVKPVAVVQFTEYLRPANAAFLAYFAIGGLGLILIAWLQIGSLLVTRTAERSVELQVRRALGATVADLSGLVVLESVFVVALSLLIAWLMVPALIAGIVGVLQDRWTPAMALRPDWRTLVFSAAVAACGAVALSLTALGFVRRADPTQLIRGTSTTGASQSLSRTRRAVFVLQVGSATALVYVASLVAQSYSRVSSVEIGFVPDHLLALPIPFPRGHEPKSSRNVLLEARGLTREVLERLRSLDGVASVAASGVLPIERSSCEPQVFRAGFDRAGSGIAGFVCVVGAGFFQTLDVQFVEGREPKAAETEVILLEGGPAVVNASFAKYLRQFGNPVDQHVYFKPKFFYRVAGVAPDLKLDHPDDRDRPTVFVYGRPDDGYVILVRADPSVSISALSKAVQQVGQDVWGDRAPRQAMLVRDAATDATADYRGRAIIIVLICIGAFPVVFAGVAGASTQMFAQRRAELAVRMALGLSSSAAMVFVVKQFAALCLLSISLGSASGVIFGRSMSAVLFGLAGTHYPSVFAVAAVMAVLCAVMLAIPLRQINQASISHWLRDP